MTAKTDARHIAIILDGNRRFAKRLMLEPWKGHEHGKNKVEQLLEWCLELGLKELTLYSFSIQNFNRPKDEFNYLMKLMRDAFDSFSKDERVKKYSIKVNVIGRYNLFPKDVVESIDNVIELTKNNKGFVLNFALAYGGREEILDAVKLIAKQVSDGELDLKDIDEKLIERNLYSASEPDIVVRTGGEIRTSNFLIWQSNYSEWFFLDKMWPEFTKEDLKKILEEYKSRERRFGR